MRRNFESELLDTISDPQSMLTVMVMTKLLSQHSLDEEFLNSPEHSYIKARYPKSSSTAIHYYS